MHLVQDVVEYLGWKYALRPDAKPPQTEQPVVVQQPDYTITIRGLSGKESGVVGQLSTPGDNLLRPAISLSERRRLEQEGR